MISVHALIAAHVTHWWLTGKTLSPLEPSEAMAFSIRGAVNPGLVFFAAAILATALFGRFFCGWGCHLVALQDFSRWLLARVGIRPRPFRSRLLLWVPLVACCYMFVWPIAYRLATRGGFAEIHTEWTTTTFWATFPSWPVTVVTFVVCGFVAVYFLGAKGFCTYACPYGAIFGLVDRLAPVRIRVTDACEGCGHCTATCTSNVRVHEEVRSWGMVVDPGCMKCMDCVSVCPKDALYLGPGRPAIGAEPRHPAPRPRHRHGWRQELAMAGVFAVAFLTLRGLYGQVPFLLSLGSAAVLTYLTFQAWLLTQRPHLRIRRWTLKRGGKLQPAGVGFTVLMTMVGLLWIHSALIQLYSFRVEHRLRIEHRLRDDHRLGDDHRLAATPSETQEALQNAAAVVRHLDFLNRWSLIHDPRTEKRAAQAYSSWGLLQIQQGELSAGETTLRRGLAAAPRSPELLYDLGMIELTRGAAEPAIALFEKALQVRPDYLAARENLAGVLCSIGRYREGLEHFGRAVELAPGDATTHLLMARAHLGLQDSASAEVELRRALELDPGQRQAQALLASLRATDSRSASSPPGTNRRNQP